MLHLYLDTNSYLSFYHLTSEDLDELQKLQALITEKEITLILPQQTEDEFKRNREGKIADALRLLKEQKAGATFSQICREFPEYQVIRDAIKNYEVAKSQLEKALRRKISDNDLAADKVVDKLFRFAKKLETTPDLIQRARTRFDLGRPPGKKKSYGDALNWETLLDGCDKGDDLHFVSGDGDFFSVIDPEAFNPYLLTEWKEAKDSELYAYRRPSQFFKAKFPDIELASEYEKEKAIERLEDSGNFVTSKSCLRKLEKFEEFTDEQLERIVSAANDNNQIYWIGQDPGISEKFQSIIGRHLERINPELLAEFYSIYEYTWLLGHEQRQGDTIETE